MSTPVGRPTALLAVWLAALLALGLLGPLIAGCGVKSPPRPPTPATLSR